MLENQIRKLEERLLDPVVRASSDELDRLISDDFLEFGSSGQKYTKSQVIAALTRDPSIAVRVVNDFRLIVLAPDAALALYRLENSLRSSLWRQQAGQWRLVFHQGTPTPTTVIRVFVQNEAGSDRKNYHNERSLEYLTTKTVSRNYPFPYGFVIGTSAPDGCCVDCFIITSRNLRSGEVVDCEPIGLMEQMEDGLADHNVLARPMGEQSEVSKDVEAVLTEFVSHVFDHADGKRITTGRFLGQSAGLLHIRAAFEA